MTRRNLDVSDRAEPLLSSAPSGFTAASAAPVLQMRRGENLTDVSSLTPPPPDVYVAYEVGASAPPLDEPTGYLSSIARGAVNLCNTGMSRAGALTDNLAQKAARYQTRSYLFEALAVAFACAYFWEHRSEVSLTSFSMILADAYIGICVYMAYRTMSFGRSVRAAATALLPEWKPEYTVQVHSNGYKLASTVLAAGGSAGLLYGVHHTLQTTDPTNPLGQFTTGLGIVGGSCLALLTSNLLSARGERRLLDIMGVRFPDLPVERKFKPRDALSNTVLATAGLGGLTLLAAFGTVSKFAIDMQNTTFTDQRQLTSQQRLEKFLGLGLGVAALFLFIDAVALTRDKMERIAYQYKANRLTAPNKFTPGAITNFNALRSVSPNAWIRDRATCDKMKLMALLAASSAFIAGIDLYGQVAVPIGMLGIAFLTRFLAWIDKGHQIDLAAKLCLVIKYKRDFMPDSGRVEPLDDEEEHEQRSVAAASARSDAVSIPFAEASKAQKRAPSNFNIEALHRFTPSMYHQVARLPNDGDRAWAAISQELENAMEEAEGTRGCCPGSRSPV